MHWIPWKFITKRAARAYGVLDPITFMARLRRFSQPSEVQEPIELLRAGILFHARGLINTKAIQHNLDWVWPYWVERQFNPSDHSFIPRAFSFSHVNLTHRNWTAVGHPDLPIYPIIDPRGLVTPLYDGWSLDVWFMTEDHQFLLPSRLEAVEQTWELSPNLCVHTKAEENDMGIGARVWLNVERGVPELYIRVSAKTETPGWLVVALRPYNPEGIQFIEKISNEASLPGWLINSRYMVQFSEAPSRLKFSNYDDGDVIHQLDQPGLQNAVSCRVGMASAAALFPADKWADRTVDVRVPLESELPRRRLFTAKSSAAAWSDALSSTAALNVPDEKIQFLYDAAVRSLLLLSARQIVPGPYTYKRFWFRDACLMLNALMAIGCLNRSRRILDTFPDLQKVTGYFQSQEGEWDSNGQVLWIMERYLRLSGDYPNNRWLRSIYKGVQWIKHKRCDRDQPVPHAGLFPAGFSAEHLGPNDYYYWDDFWGLAGLKAAGRIVENQSLKRRQDIAAEATDFEASIFNSIRNIPANRSQGGIPATPYRRMDAGAIGSMVADYPLQLTEAMDGRIRHTMEFLIHNCFYKGAFFQDMIHSGINIYLTLAIAQTLLRREDTRYREMIHVAARLASATGQWPEAVHPQTEGGCMGDGQHGWAAAEWIMMIRNLFVREEGDALVLGAGIFPDWLQPEKTIGFGPTPTPYGSVSLWVTAGENDLTVYLDIDWKKDGAVPKEMVLAIPGYPHYSIPDFSQHTFTLDRADA
ncbi:MAG TPA: hypothetical protein VKN73_14490 [Desulfosalsimonadaceae bacterium]|nr:hypothetical protein [Desulfosalsimonadaceae bacterium]